MKTKWVLRVLTLSALVLELGFLASGGSQAWAGKGGGGDWDFEDLFQPPEAKLVIEATQASVHGTRCDHDRLAVLIQPLFKEAQLIVTASQKSRETRRVLPLDSTEFACLSDAVKDVAASSSRE